MKTISHLVIRKYRRCSRCGQEEPNPEEITVEIKPTIKTDEKSERVTVELLYNNE